MARKVAYDLGLPWKLLALREYAWQYVSIPDALQAWKDHDRNLGFPFPHQAYIYRELKRHVEDAKPSPPSEESVRAAYQAYSKDAWKNLIPKLNPADLRTLLLYLRDNKHQLTRAQVEQNDIAETEPGDLARRVG